MRLRLSKRRQNQPQTPENNFRLSLPNSITLFRIFLVPFFFTELLNYHPNEEHHRWIAIVIYTVAALTDCLDGFIARVTHKQTELGQFLDPLADKLLLLSGYLGILFVNYLPYKPPVWVTVTIVFRDLMIILGMIVVYLHTGKIKIQPNFLGKITTVAQMITLFSVLLFWPYSFIAWNIAAFLTILSLLSYFRRDIMKLALS